jgi:hypothetical protein
MSADAETADAEAADPEPVEPDSRTLRALQEDLQVLDADLVDIDEVASHVVFSGRERYSVDLLGGYCDCPDALHRGVRCKHLRVVEFWTGERAVPEWVEPDALGDFLRRRLRREGRR